MAALRPPRRLSDITGRGQILSIAALGALNAVGETRSLGALIERAPGLSYLDRLGRP